METEYNGISAVGNRAEWTKMSMEQRLNYVHTVVGDTSPDGVLASERYAAWAEIPMSPIVVVQEQKTAMETHANSIFCGILSFHRKKTHPHWIQIRENMILVYEAMPTVMEELFEKSGVKLEDMITLGTEVCSISYHHYRLLALSMAKSKEFPQIKEFLKNVRAA